MITDDGVEMSKALSYYPEVIRKLTPMTERLVVKKLKQTGEVGLDYKNNKKAYYWRMFELAHPWRAKLNGLFLLGPYIAFGI